MSEQAHYLAIFMSIRGQLARIASRIVPPKDIEDIVQESYVRLCLMENREEIRVPSSFLMKTVKNLSLDHVKRAESRLASGIDDEAEFGSYQNGVGYQHSGYQNGAAAELDTTLDQVDSNQQFALFAAAVRNLPVKCQRVFILKKVYGYSQREISEKLGITENTVEKHLVSGMQKCRKYMRSERNQQAHRFSADAGAAETSPVSTADGKTAQRPGAGGVLRVDDAGTTVDGGRRHD